MSSDNLIGRKLANRYEILALIGTGGMATVYKAKCELLKRFVAIKVLRDNLRDDEAVVKSFNKEAQAAASLSHNNIVSVYDVGEEDGLNYMVMEYVDGITLKQYIKEKQVLPWQEACDFAIQIGQALSVAHGEHIVHRDIKPQNILMTQDKTLKVTDFGIAKATAAETMTMGANSAMGSVHYISPEQARGGYVDERSDLYSLGVVLYEMLAGRVPFDGETAVAVALMHIEKDPVPIRQLNPNISADLAHIVDKAMSKEQLHRYQTAQEMVNDLHAVLADEPLPSAGTGEEEEDMGKTRVVPSVLPDENVEADIPEFYEEAVRKGKKAKNKKKPKTAEQKKADKLATILAITTIILVAVLGIGGYFFLRAGSGDAPAPELLNMTLEEAQAAVAEKGFKLSEQVEYSLSDSVEEGRIISQNPGAKEMMKKNKEIKVVVSIGASGGSIEVPGVTGISVEDAIVQIVEADLTYTIVEDEDDKVAKGMVVRQSPESGTKVNKNEVITLHVSTGKPEENATEAPVENVTVPDLMGDTKEKAEASLRDNGLKLGNVSRKASDLPEGTVISQSPTGGKNAKKNSFVSIVLSSGAAEEPPASQAPEKTDAPSASKSPATAVPTKRPEGGAGGAEKTKTLTLTVPGSEGEAQVRIEVDGKTVYNKTNKRGESISVDISGTGSVNVVSFVDGEIVSTKTVSFD